MHEGGAFFIARAAIGWRWRFTHGALAETSGWAFTKAAAKHAARARLEALRWRADAEPPAGTEGGASP